MSSIITVLLLTLTWAAGQVSTSIVQYDYIISARDSPKSDCSSLDNEIVCLSLMQFVQRWSSRKYEDNVTITLIFEPGEYSLSSGIVFNDLSQVSLWSLASGESPQNKTQFVCKDTSCFSFYNVQIIQIENLFFSECTSKEGSAVYAYNIDSISITQCSFMNNLATENGGAIYIQFATNVHILQSQFFNNSAICNPHNITQCSLDCTSTGGAIVLFHARSVTIGQSHFINNAAACIGGAISALYSHAVVTESQFAGNIALSEGGALNTQHSYIQVRNSTFTASQALIGGAFSSISSSYLITGGGFYLNKAYQKGGVIYSLDTSISMVNTLVQNNSADTGGALATESSEVNLTNCLFHTNTAIVGGVAELYDTSTIIHSSYFQNSRATNTAGALKFVVDHPTVIVAIANSYFTNNSATYAGAIGLEGQHQFIETSCDRRGEWADSLDSRAVVRISSCTFVHNTAKQVGGALLVTSAKLSIQYCRFQSNDASSGIMYTEMSALYAQHNVLLKNTGQQSVVLLKYGTMESLNNSYLSNSVMLNGGAMYTICSTINLTHDKYINNTALFGGGALDLMLSNVSVFHCVFRNNKAIGISDGGALRSIKCSLYCIDCHFVSNTGAPGALSLESSMVVINQTTIHRNTGLGTAIYQNYGSMLLLNTTVTENYSPARGFVIHLENVDISFYSLTFNRNNGSIFLLNSAINCSGKITLMNNTSVMGGALAAYQSTLFFQENSQVTISDNVAAYGGGISLSESEMHIYTATFAITNNTASEHGGGIFAYQSKINMMTNDIGTPILLTRNTAAQNGGGMYAVSTALRIFQAQAQVSHNQALVGGGMFLETFSKIYTITGSKKTLNCTDINKLIFQKNTADIGGAIYVNDISNSGTICKQLPNHLTNFLAYGECFLQTIRLDHSHLGSIQSSIIFHDNTAHTSGNDIFGGLLDRCYLNWDSKQVAINIVQKSNDFKSTYEYLNSVAQFDVNLTNIYHNASTRQQVRRLISSGANQLCFCNAQNYSCSYQHAIILTERGKPFSVKVVTLDQMENPVDGTVLASVNSNSTSLKVGQLEQTIRDRCTEVTYNLYSTETSTALTLYPDGPCNSIGVSSKTLNITFIPCDCPNGLQQAPLDNECRCVCHSSLATYMSNCKLNQDEIVVTRLSEDMWINYIINETVPGFEVVQCPRDYCIQEPTNLSIDLPWGVDEQCAFNRSGIMCGKCEEGLSLVLGSNRCLSCTNNTLALLVAFAVAGISLVVLILILNMTVATGSIHGIALYVNVIASNSPIFLPQETTLSFFISWLNLDLGIETCFYSNMDSYAKFLLQLLFPLFIIFLTVVIIVASHYWGRFARLIGPKNPVATLCTLILLSYSKLLQTIIIGFQFTRLVHPDGSTKTLWLYDPNVPYFTISHIPRFIIAILITIFGATFTLLLLFGQWLRRWVKWTRNVKYNTFVDAYHAPFVAKHRYWIGLLLLFRIAHHLLTALLPTSAHLLVVSCLVLMLIIVKLLIHKIYKTWLLNMLETSYLINLLVLAVSTSYVQNTTRNQVTLATISVFVAFIPFCGLVAYHTHTNCLTGWKCYQKSVANIKQCLQTLLIKNRRQRTIEAESLITPQTNTSMRNSDIDLITPLTPSDYWIPPTTNVPSIVTSTIVDIHGDN